jgi:hypothetical protein
LASAAVDEQFFGVCSLLTLILEETWEIFGDCVLQIVDIWVVTPYSLRLDIREDGGSRTTGVTTQKTAFEH